MISRLVNLVALMMLLVFLGTSDASKIMDKSEMTFYILTIALPVLIFLYTERKKNSLNKYYIRHTLLALFGILVVHYQVYIDYVIGNINKYDDFVWIEPRVVKNGLILSGIGIICFLLGIQFETFFFKNKTSTAGNDKLKVIDDKFLIFLAFISLIVFFSTVNPLYLAGFYGAEKMGATAIYASLMLELFVFSVLIQRNRNIRIRGTNIDSFKNYIFHIGIPITVIICIYLIGIIFSGDRGPVITFVIAYLGGFFFVSKKKISLKTLLLSIFISATFITLLGEARNLDKKKGFLERLSASFELKKDKYERTSFLPQTLELAASIRTLHTALDYVPEKHDYTYGRFQFQALFSSIPFINIFRPIIFDDLHFKYNDSANFITWVNQGEEPTSGDGTSCIADFYIDFGVLGVIIGMFLFGRLMRFSELVFYSDNLPSTFVNVLVFVYLSQSIYIARSYVLFDFKTVVWICIILYLNKHFLSKIIR